MKLVDGRLSWEISTATATATAARDSPSSLHKSRFNILKEESALAVGRQGRMELCAVGAKIRDGSLTRSWKSSGGDRKQ